MLFSWWNVSLTCMNPGFNPLHCINQACWHIPITQTSGSGGKRNRSSRPVWATQ